MKRKIILLLMSSLLVPFLLKAEWIPLDKKNTTPTEPKITLISEDNTSTVIKIEISGFEVKDFSSDDHTYQKIDLLSESFTITPGSPELPYIAKILAIPDQAGVSIEVLEKGEVQLFPNISLPPARESWVEGSPETAYNENPVVYNSTKAYPGKFAECESPSIFRDFRITRVSVFPVQYNPAQKEIRVVNSITIRINYNAGKGINPKNTPKKPIAPSFGELYRSFIFNYQSVLDNLYGGKEDGHELMLCIMPDEFVASFQTYADWKRQSGIDIHITKFSDIGANSTNTTIIKNHIVDAYLNWEVPPTYVLLVGDDGVFPVYTSGYVDENYFGEIEGNDYFPDVMIGRFTNQSDYGMQVMINKFMLYEQNPYTTSTDWFKKGICCSNDAYVSQIETKRFAAERMLLDGGFTSVDTMMSDPGCTYNVTDVKNAINNGRSWLNYRGEGWSSGWWASCTPMNTSDVSSLNNGQKFTFVTSIGCGVAMFASGSGNCFGEEWVESGTLSNPKGAVAFIGPAGNTHTTYNNKIDKGIYIGMFQEGLETPGQALVRGKLYMYNVFGNVPYVESHYKLYCVLGDPSIHIWKDVPKDVTVNYPPSIPFGTSTVEFTVTHTATGQPVTNAVVCVTGLNQFATDCTDEFGNAYVDVEAIELETFNVTVRGGNVIPFQGDLIVVQPTGAYVVKDSYTINDAAGGNGDGLMDYGETNLLSLSMINVGVEEAVGVVVTINSINPYITITDNSANYGNIAAGATGIVTDGFAYTVANNIPDLEEVSITITATSGSNTWVSYINIVGHAPILEYLDYDIADPNGNNNGKFDPGETVNIIVHIENSGSSEAMNVLGQLMINDPYVTLNTPQASFGNVSGATQASAIFSASADFTTPAGYLAEFTLSINANLGISGSGELGIVVGQVPVLILDLDENGNSAPDMETALNTMDVTYETLQSFPPDLNLYSTIFVCLGIFSDNHVLTSSEGQILANYLNDGGSLYMEGGDTWYFDQSTAVHAMFNINPTADGSGNMTTVVGQTGTFTEGMSFNYTGDNSWMDHIEAIEPAFKIFDNQSPLYGTGVAYDDGDYKTIGTSHEFGGLQDGASPSTKEELMAAYLEFLGITVSLQAAFIADETNVCEGESVSFYDQSSGNAMSWDWIFEGGTPATSTQQNPVIMYSTSGNYDVLLTVSDGTSSNSLFLQNYISVSSMPQTAPAPTGPASVCATTGSSSYSTTGLPGITIYEWVIEPTDAGTVYDSGLNAMILWTNGYTGEAMLKVAGVNDCGTGDYSLPITITRYLPEVTLEPFDWVCLDWPAFELTGGMPEGGEYSGPGVENGWFNPSMAGTGTHTITYTYTDPNSCENFASDTILVDPCTGIDKHVLNSDILIYPNPGKGIFSIRFNQGVGKIDLELFNSVNEKVLDERNLNVTTNLNYDLDLNYLPAGIYYLHVTGNEIDNVLKIVIQN